MNVQPNMAIISGEMSGDAVAGALAGALRAIRPDLQLWGIGSRRAAAAGVELIHDSAQWSAIGVVEALKLYPELRLKMYPHLLREIERRAPAVVVLIDFGAFNVKVARWCKSRNIRVLYYFPPGSWRKSGREGAELARITDLIATPFPWSAERLQRLGANVEFVGHPLLELAQPSLTRTQFAEQFGMEPGEPIIGLLPGSRHFEVDHNTPAMMGAAWRIYREQPSAQFVFGLASSTSRECVEMHIGKCKRLEDKTLEAVDRTSDLWSKEVRDKQKARLVTPEGVVVSISDFEKRVTERRRALERNTLPPLVLTENLTYDVMAHSDVVLVCSGTATLEAALLGTPMVILYRGSRLMEWEAKVRRVRPEHIGMPNIIAGKRIVPEFIQHDATPEALAEQALRFLGDPESRARVKAELQHVRDALGTPGASERTAYLALKLADLLPSAPTNVLPNTQEVNARAGKG